ncbi:diguanylate cyclase [Pseudomonas sp. ABC1]|uniref:GGDEF domain-containing protein n=1 Tax=Pseudomonas sp. ABC1 TaxID=2748080 RepID=UPI0015C2FA92|nr:sensor domain-containing diguanylate cyclase [Pseudomonas sp. ABC1]QLF91722.1 diguanylate cyclase [Pseudomonas sp. ABC1]
MLEKNRLSELHGLLAIVQSIDIGVVVIDRNYRVEVWNTFMENRSGRLPSEAFGRSFFELFPEVDEAWFRRKVETVATLGTPVFTIWEQRPYLLHFKNYQPITGLEDFMYQNTTILPLKGLSGVVDQVCLLIYDVTDVATNRHQLQAANRELQRLSSTDRLTGLYNRGHWEERLRQEFARYSRSGGQASLVMFDIDHFKRINDSYGHQTGDAVIRRVADAVRMTVRDSDIAGRYGGEEFAVLLPDTDRDGARIFAERLRGAVQEQRVSYEGQSVCFTISLGVAESTQAVLGAEQLIAMSDRALYESKAQGRNRTSLYGVDVAAEK